MKTHSSARNMWKSDKPIPVADDDKGDFSRGIRRLSGAVMLQAIVDMKKGPLIDSYSALCWVQDGNIGDLTFNTCCEVLERDTEDTRCDLVGMYGPGIEWDIARAKAEAAEARAKVLLIELTPKRPRYRAKT